MTDEDDDNDTSLALFWRVAKPQPSMVVLAGEEGLGSTILDLDLQDMLKIQWPNFVAEATKSRYEGKKLPNVKRTGKQLLTIFLVLLEEFAVSWRNKGVQREASYMTGSSA